MKALFFIFAVLILSGCIDDSQSKLTPAEYTVKEGDSVEIEYSYEGSNGTSAVIIGEEKFPEKIENSLIGMSEGEEKEISVTPEEGYGYRDEAKVSPFPRISYYPIIDVMPLEIFATMFRSEPVLNASYDLGYWNMSITAVNKENVTVKNNAQSMEINEPWGDVALTLNGTHIRKEIMPRINTSMHTLFGHAWIRGFNDTSMLLDFNHPLAGKSVLFKIKIKSITSSSEKLGETRKYGGIEFRSFEKGTEEAGKYGKILLVYFRSDSCYWCKKFEDEVLTNKEVIDKIKGFIPVAVDVYAEKKIAAKFNVLGTPTIVFTDTKENELKKIIGFRDAEEFLEEMNEVLEAKNAKS